MLARDILLYCNNLQRFLGLGGGCLFGVFFLASVEGKEKIANLIRVKCAKNKSMF